MPFQPTRSAINPVQLALSIREMRMKQQQAERQFQLDKIAAIGDAKDKEIARAKAMMELQQSGLKLQNDLQTQEGSAAPLAVAANNTELPNEQRQSAANAFINSLNQGISNRVGLGQDVNSAATTVGANAGGVIATEATSRQSELANRKLEKQQDFVFSQKEKIADENRRREAEERAREQGHWDRGDLIQEKVRLEKKFDPASKTNEDWNALKKLGTENKAINYLEIVQRWVRNVDEGATVREGDIDLVRAFGMSGMEEFKAWLAGTADAEAKISAVSKESIKTAFEQLLEQRDRSWADAWGSANDYADAVGWEKRDRATALPQSRAMRRVLERHDKRSLGGVLVPDAFKTESNFSEANKRAAQRLHISGSRVSPKEAMFELKRMYQDVVNRGR